MYIEVYILLWDWCHEVVLEGNILENMKTTKWGKTQYTKICTVLFELSPVCVRQIYTCVYTTLLVSDRVNSLLMLFFFSYAIHRFVTLLFAFSDLSTENSLPDYNFLFVYKSMYERLWSYHLSRYRSCRTQQRWYSQNACKLYWISGHSIKARRWIHTFLTSSSSPLKRLCYEIRLVSVYPCIVLSNRYRQSVSDFL